MDVENDLTLMVKAHHLAIERLELCEYVMDHQNACLGACGDCPESPASASYCGCADCVVREVIHASFPAIARHVASLLAEELIRHGASMETTLGRVARSIREMEIRNG